MGFQALGLDSRYTSVVQVNNNTEGTFQQESARTYDVGIDTSASISPYSDSGNPYMSSTDQWVTLFNDTTDHFTGTIDVDVDVDMTSDGAAAELYVNGTSYGSVQSNDDFNKTKSMSAYVTDASIGRVRVENTGGYGITVNYDINVYYNSNISSNYNVTGVTQE